MKTWNYWKNYIQKPNISIGDIISLGHAEGLEALEFIVLSKVNNNKYITTDNRVLCIRDFKRYYDLCYL